MREQTTDLTMQQNQTSQFQPGEINMSKWISNGWDLIMKDFGNFLLLSFVYVALLTIAFSTWIIGLIVAGPLTAGFFYIIFSRIRGRNFYLGDIIKGFEVWVPAALADILISIFVGLGFIFLIIPGIIISALYLFAIPLIIEKRMDFWQAMETSRKLVSRNLLEFSIFMLLLYVILFIGVLILGVGFLVALPVTFAAIAYAYADLIGLENEEQASR
ncbi:MAG: hypothetical protein ONB13_05575 [candidate division KSB1 bacterium]|nr:hypothetical protein [candidate division KSB1 bacterium]MDZ7336083.1 hypothetical protein [candidate division KSB1 bacterium]MDZ7376070.1 hypothetical protein [candidate division KSB1 bacterium]MDZ7401817.1 hypothetical protein [candidate division KSB1 bacterium]